MNIPHFDEDILRMLCSQDVPTALEMAAINDPIMNLLGAAMPTLSDIDNQIAVLEAQKKQIVADEKKDALKAVEVALTALNGLGFNYSLTEATTKSRKRRIGVRANVLAVIAKADGITPAQIAEALGITDKSGKNSVANALTALKKSGHVKADNSVYSPT